MKIQVMSSLVVMPLHWLCLCNHFLVVSGQCLDDQKSMLLKFKNNLTFTSTANTFNSKLKGWNASDDCCIWDGVYCYEEGHVTYLDVSGESISGGFDDSSALFNLQHLQTLILRETDFAGAFPRSVGKLRHLSELDLSDCGFNGTIPNSLSNLTELIDLDLSNNKFTGPTTSFGMSKNLIQLDLSGNYLNGIIPSSHFEGLHNLDYVDLSDNSFIGSIPSSLLSLPSLQKLRLDHNQFSQLDEFINVSSSILDSLYLSNNNLSGRVPSYLFTLPHLQYLYLDYNQFSQLDEFINVSSSSA